jgi:hypothetical protein
MMQKIEMPGRQGGRTLKAVMEMKEKIMKGEIKLSELVDHLFVEKIRGAKNSDLKKLYAMMDFWEKVLMEEVSVDQLMCPRTKIKICSTPLDKPNPWVEIFKRASADRIEIDGVEVK